MEISTAPLFSGFLIGSFFDCGEVAERLSALLLLEKGRDLALEKGNFSRAEMQLTAKPY